MAPALPPAPSTTAPSCTAITAVNAPPSSTYTKDVSRKPIPRRRAWSHTPRTTAQSLSAVPMSIRFTLRCSGTLARWITPGGRQTGRPLSLSAPMICPMPPTIVPPDRPSSSASTMRPSSRGPTSATWTQGSPYPDGPTTRSTGPASRSASTSDTGRALTSAVGSVASSITRSPSRPHTSKLTVPGSTPRTRGPVLTARPSRPGNPSAVRTPACTSCRGARPALRAPALAPDRTRDRDPSRPAAGTACRGPCLSGTRRD